MFIQKGHYFGVDRADVSLAAGAYPAAVPYCLQPFAAIGLIESILPAH